MDASLILTLVIGFCLVVFLRWVALEMNSK